MSESHVCPECGAKLPADAPEGLCPRCLLGAGLAESQFDRTYESGADLEDRQTAFEPSPSSAEASRPASPVTLDQFKNAVQDLGLIPAAEFERFVSGALGGVPNLAKALVAAGKLTPYQAGALTQGKTRGLVIGKYLVLDKLGAGGMGVVFRAKHRRLGRIVALKILPPSLARNSELLKRFRREVDVAANLSHPNIVSVLDADDDRGVQFMTMEYIKGNDLDHLVRDGGPLPIDLALDCTIQAARGLGAAHAKGIVHRDIKPGNLMLDESGMVRVLDLGLARLIEATNPFGETVSGPLTQSGTYMGTVDFMAPEQGVDSHRVDHRADIYSLGCTLGYLLTGRPPFDAPNVLARLMAHQERPPAPLPAIRPAIPKAVDAVYQKMMAKHPTDRPASMNEVVNLLEACRSSSLKDDDARSGLKTFAESVVLKRVAPKRTVRETLVVVRDEPPELAKGPDLKREDAGFPKGVQDRPATLVAQTAVLQPTPVPKRPAATAPRRSKTGVRPALALGAIVLLVIGVLGWSLFSRGPTPTAGGRIPPTPTAESSSGKPAAGASSPGSSPSVAAPQPSAASTYDVATFFGYHGAPWFALAATANGRHVLVGGATQTLGLVNVDTANVEHSFGWHFAAISDVAMTPDGRIALVSTIKAPARENVKNAGTLWFWDVRSRKKLFPMQQPYPGDVTSVALSADGSFGLSGGQHGELTLWDLTNGNSLKTLGPQQGRVAPHGMAFFSDGNRAATAGADQVVHIWDINKGREQSAWKGHDGPITGLALSADDRRLVTGSNDGTVILWDASSGKVLKRFKMPPDDTGAHVAFDSEGHIIAAGRGLGGSAPKPGHLIVWDATTYAELRRDEHPFARNAALAPLPGGRVLTAGEYAIRIWKPRTPGADAGAPASSNEPVNLLKLIAAKPSANWRSTDSELRSPGTAYARLAIPYSPPWDYRIDMKVELVGKEVGVPFELGLVVAGRQTQIAFDRALAKDAREAKGIDMNARYTGLDDYDGLPVPYGPKPHRGQILVPSRPVRISVTVRPNSVRATCDDVTVVDWTGDPKGLVRHVHWPGNDKKTLFIASYGSIVIHEMTLTPRVSAGP